jgi:hypothetical protein
MLRRLWKKPAIPIQRRIPVWIALVAYLFAVFGPPLPAAPPVSSCAPGNTNSSCCCCSTGEDNPCCCCCSTEPTEKDPAQPAKAQTKKKTASWGLGIFARSCGGAVPIYLTFEPAVTPPNLVDWNYEWSFVGSMPFECLASEIVPLDPVDPPPRAASISM